MSDPLKHSTLPPRCLEGAPSRPVLVLTTLCHPDLTRVGERAVLGELRPPGAAALSRSTPLFGAPPGRPLEDPYLSRHPIELASTSEASLELRPSRASAVAEVDGQRLDGPRHVSSAALRRGVVLELAGRVVLLLHLETERARGPRPSSFGLVGESQALEAVRWAIHQVAGLPVAVMLRGETGSGKELIAQAIAEASPFGRPFIAVNMGAIPPSVAASELFGAAKGAFTGAVASKGYFRKADGGTLFLDEIGQTPHEVQAHLLRVLDSGEVQPLGERAPAPVRVRVIAATDLDLERSIVEGQFMEGLLQRLATFQIGVPSLRERLDDLGRLLVHFLREELTKLGEHARLAPRPLAEPAWLPAPLVARMARYDWPGNVRELRNVATQLAISSRGRAEALADADLLRRLVPSRSPSPVLDPERPAPAATPAPPPALDGAPAQRASPSPGRAARGERRGMLSPELVAETLHRCGRNFTLAAKELGVSRTTLLKHAKELELYRGPDEVTDEELLALEVETHGDLDVMAERLQQARRGLELRLARLRRLATTKPGGPRGPGRAP